MRARASVALLFLLAACATPVPDQADPQRPVDVDAAPAEGTPFVPEGRCGDGIRQDDEACDGEQLGGLTCQTFDERAVGALKCREDCTLDATECGYEAPVPEDCGDGTTCAGAGNIIDALDWVDAREVTDEAQRAVASASGRIDFRENGQSMRCSATLIDRDLLITNHHCAPNATVAATVRFSARTERGVSSGQQLLGSYACPELVATDCAHDVSILRCRAHASTGRLPGDEHGLVNLGLNEPVRRMGLYVVHTNCDYRSNTSCTPYKLVSPGTVTTFQRECITFTGDSACGNCRSTARQARHTADTLGGSSGGGVFDATDHTLIGLNWGGTAAANSTGGWNYFASLADLVEANDEMAAILLPLANREPVVPEELTPTEQLAAARTGGTHAISGALITALVPDVGNEPSGFILQAEKDGPALFVEADDSLLGDTCRVGDRISLVVTATADVDGRVHAKSFRDLTVLDRGHDPAPLAKPLNELGYLAGQLSALDAELVTGTVRVTGAFVESGARFVAAPVTVEGSPSAGAVVLRLPATVLAELPGLGNGATVRLTAPLWRYRAKAQLGVWSASTLSVDGAPAPLTVVGAEAPDLSTVVVTFDRALDAGTVTLGAFSVSGLGVLGAYADDRRAVLNTTAQPTSTRLCVRIAGTVRAQDGGELAATEACWTSLAPPPVLTATVEATSPTQVDVRFSRTLAAGVGAEDFVIDDLDITAAAVDGEVVHLTTTGQEPGRAYALLIDASVCSPDGLCADDSPLVFSGFEAPAVAEGSLIISEYVEGAGFDKALELQNIAEASLILDGISVCLETNAADLRRTGCTQRLRLTGTLAPGAVLTICHPQLNRARVPANGCQLVDGTVTGFNGDDRLYLVQDADGDGSINVASDLVLDAFGQLGQRPATNLWADVTFRRVQASPADGLSPFSVDALYERLPLGELSGLGTPASF